MGVGSLAEKASWYRLAAAPEYAVKSDADLLALYVSGRDELAFETLVRRHGAMVLGVCHRVLRHAHDAEDAFQATFLVLAFKARAISPRATLAGWLHGVARRTALKARSRAARRAVLESRVPPGSADAMTADPESVLDEELARLPDCYRLPIVLCDLEGRLRTEVAVTLGCSEGTLSSRLTRGRRMLADLLRRRGVAVPTTMLSAALTAPGVVAEPLVRAAACFALTPAGAGAVSPSVAELATGVIKGMMLKKLQSAGMAVLIALATTVGFVVGVGSESRAPAAPVPVQPQAAPEDPVVRDGLSQVDGTLLTNRKVLVELKCDMGQFDRIMDRMELGQHRGTAIIRRANLVQPGTTRMLPEQRLQEAVNASYKEGREATAEVVGQMLTAAQRKRLWEVYLQSGRHEAFLWPVVAKALGLSDAQKGQMVENVEWVQTRTKEKFDAARKAEAKGVETDYEQVATDVLREATKRAEGFLTAEQRTTWTRMTGESFSHPLPRPFDLGGEEPPLPGSVPPPPIRATPPGPRK